MIPRLSDFMSEEPESATGPRRAGSRETTWALICRASDSTSVLQLRQILRCTLQEAILLVMQSEGVWFTGARPDLEHAAKMLRERGLETSVEEVGTVTGLPVLEEGARNWAEIARVLRRRGTLD